MVNETLGTDTAPPPSLERRRTVVSLRAVSTSARLSFEPVWKLPRPDWTASPRVWRCNEPCVSTHFGEIHAVYSNSDMRMSREILAYRTPKNVCKTLAKDLLPLPTRTDTHQKSFVVTKESEWL